jgi:hypothetical protein
MNEAVISKVADAIAFAARSASAVARSLKESFPVAGSRPRRDNNPGDLERDLTGKGVGLDGPYVIYATAQDGRAALEHQVRLMFAGSHIYKPSMTISEVSRHYTATDPETWARNVAAHLGVTTETRLNEL